MSSNTKNNKELKNTNGINSKANYIMLEQERNLLKITLDYVVKENETLKQQNEDMKITVKHNKELLREYIEKITNKDKVVEKMNSTIDQLTQRLYSLEEYIKNTVNKKPLNSGDTSENLANFNLNNIQKNLVSHTVRTQNINMQFLTQSNPTDPNAYYAENNTNMLPSSPNIRHNTNFTNPINNLNLNEFTPNSNQKNNQQINQQFTPIINNSPPKGFQLNLTNIMKNNENYEMSLASQSNINSAQRDFYSQTQRSLMQNPIVLNPEQFNNSNLLKGSKMNEIANASNLNISQEKLKDVN